jgi:CheY-like chemotaxis protein
VLLCDVMMPGMSGVEFYKKLERVSPRHVEGVVFITGGTFRGEAERFLQKTRNSVVSKPFKLQELVRTFVVRSRENKQD